MDGHSTLSKAFQKKVFYVESPIEHGVLKQMGKKM